MKLTDEAERPEDEETWLDTLKKQLRARVVRFVAAGMAVVLAGTIGYHYFTKPNAYAVVIDGQQVAYITEEVEATEVIDGLLADKAIYGSVRHVEQVAYEPVRIKSDQLVNSQELHKTLESRLHFVSEATAIIIDGQEIGIVPNLATAENIISSIRQKYAPGDKESLTVETMAFEEEILFEPREASLESFAEPKVLEELLFHGTEKMETYQVEDGDSLWSIARRNGMTVEELQLANPELKSELLSIGQELKLVKAKPLLHLVTTYNLNKQENIPYKTKYESDANLYRGQERLKKPGVAGQKAVQYRVVERNGNTVSKEVVTEKILKEPEERIVIRGTKVMVASRGDGGSGELAWPIRGTISSSYGKRGREFHTGLDISTSRGTPIGAAEAGTVIFAGRSGNYGLMVSIDHGNGLVTRYAHCSELKVKVGEQVTRGKVIALVGATGRSSGPHLHFEVRVNGNPQNPTNYLR